MNSVPVGNKNIIIGNKTTPILDIQPWGKDKLILKRDGVYWLSRDYAALVLENHDMALPSWSVGKRKAIIKFGDAVYVFDRLKQAIYRM